MIFITGFLLELYHFIFWGDQSLFFMCAAIVTDSREGRTYLNELEWYPSIIFFFKNVFCVCVCAYL